MPVRLNRTRCALCGCCVGLCPEGALWLDESLLLVAGACTECGLCVKGCPTGALALDAGPATSMGRPSRSRYDVVVVGAGPAGSMAARAAAEAGASVLLLEKRQEIGSPVRCAEGVNRAQLEALMSPDSRYVAATVTRAEIHLFGDADGRDVFHMAAEGGEGYVLERRIFDRYLAEQAAACGAEVRVKSPVLGLVSDGPRVVGVRVRSGDDECEVGAGVVIGADGVESWVGRWAGLSGAIPARDQMTCAQVLLAGLDIDPHCLVYWISADHAPGGYIWLFPKGEGKANVGLGMQADLARESPLTALYRFIEGRPELARGVAVTLIIGGVPVASTPERLVGDGVMLVGDAARQVDPLTGGGIVPAMRAGGLAGTVAAAAVQAGSTDAGHLSAYERAWADSTGRVLARNYRLRQRFPPDQRLSRSFLRVFAAAAGG